jgi:dTDP-4-dehydrorhamnose 3,5-epimerase
MDIVRLDIPGPVVLSPTRFADTRGFLAEIFHESWFAAQVEAVHFVQENHIYSEHVGTVRGLHFQRPPKSQAKLVRVTRGRVWDVAVDLRQGSPTFGRHVGVELTRDNGRQLWVPDGFAHGFCTLEPQSEVTYKTTAYYDRDCEGAVAWDDPDLAIAWPAQAIKPILSDRDRRNPRLFQLAPCFTYRRPATSAASDACASS